MKDSTKKKSNGFIPLIMLFLFVGIPFFITKQCTSKSTVKSADQAAAPVESTASADGADAAANSTTAAGASQSDNGYEAAGTRTQTYTRDKNGVYQLAGPVMDTAQVLSDGEYSELDSFLRNLDKTTGVQIAVLTVKSLDGEDIESYSMKHAEAWKLGQKGVDNGALLTVAMEEHDVRIETGYGTEGTLTDAKCAQIIRNVIVPEFKKGDYGAGIVDGVKNMAGIITSDDSLVTVHEGSNDEEAESASSAGAGILFVVFFLLLIVIVIISSIYRALHPFSHRGTWINTGSHNDTHFNGFGGGGFGGGFSGGGGSFGGGGASGHW